MKKIYLILTYSGTVLAKLIRLTTKDEFAHVSLALDKDLNEMYSFGRLNPYNPFFGGFVHESTKSGTFKRFENTTITKIYTLEVSDCSYKKIRKTLNYMSINKEKYHFNILGLCAARFRYKITGVNSYYCAEFVKSIMDSSDIENNLPDVSKPEDFKYLENIRLCYSGMLKDYHVSLLD